MFGRPMNIKRTIYFGLVLMLFGCKEYDSSKLDQRRPVIDDFLTVSIKGVFIEDDIIEVYFTENVPEPYSKRNVRSLRVKGNKKTQEIVFKLPDRTYPMKLRIDLGSIGYETPIEIVEIRLSTGGKSKIFNIDEIMQAFRMNQFIEVDSVSNKLIRKKINGVYDPFILSGDLTKIIVDLFSK